MEGKKTAKEKQRDKYKGQKGEKKQRDRRKNKRKQDGNKNKKEIGQYAKSKIARKT